MSARADAARKLNEAVSAVTDLFASMKDDWNEAVYKMEEARSELEDLVQEAQDITGVIDISDLQDLVDACETISGQDVPVSLYVDEV